MGDRNIALAGDLARKLAAQRCDEAVVSQVFSYLQTTRDPQTFFLLLEKLPSSTFARRSNRTRSYFEATRDVFSVLKDRPLEDLLEIIGWTRRLVKAIPVVESTQNRLPQRSAPQAPHGKNHKLQGPRPGGNGKSFDNKGGKGQNFSAGDANISGMPEKEMQKLAQLKKNLGQV